jgi:hypothetical protein
MIAASMFSAVASGLMTMFDVDLDTWLWTVSLVLSGVGFGLGGQQCMMVPQTILKGDDISLGTSVIMFAESVSGVIFLAVGENIFYGKLRSELVLHAPNVDPNVVISSGATGLQTEIMDLYDAETVQHILKAYSTAMGSVWVICTVLASLGLFGAVSTEWVSVKGGRTKIDEKASV